MAAVDLPPDVFIFNEKNRGFISGETRHLGGEGAIRRTIKFSIIFYLTLALPLSVLVALFFTLVMQESFVAAFLRTAIVVLLLTLYIAFSGYRVRKKLEARGQILVGEINSYDARRTFGQFGYRKAPRIKYHFLSPSGKALTGYALIPPQNATRLPDGRELPQPGTPVAILYSDIRSYTLL